MNSRWKPVLGFLGLILSAITLLFFSIYGALLIALATVVIILFFAYPFPMLLSLVAFRVLLDAFYQIPLLELRGIGAVNVSSFLGVLIFVLGALFIAAHIKKKIYLPVSIKIFFLFLAWMLVGTIFAFDKIVALGELVRIADVFFIFLLAYMLINSSGKRLVMLLSLIGVSLIPVIVGISQLLFGVTIEQPHGLVAEDLGRIFGTFIHPNAFAFYLLFMIGVLFWALETHIFSYAAKPLRGKFGIRYIEYLGFALVMFYAVLLFFTYSRSALIGLVLLLLVVVIRKHKPLIFPLLLFFSLIIFTSPNLHERFFEAFVITDPSNSLAWRYFLWSDTKHLLFESPFVGIGLNNFALFSEQLRPRMLGSVSSHNDYIKFLAETGLVGLALFGALWYSIIRSLFRFETLIAITMVILLIISFFDNVFAVTALQFPLWMVLGALLRKQKMAK